MLGSANTIIGPVVRCRETSSGLTESSSSAANVEFPRRLRPKPMNVSQSLRKPNLVRSSPTIGAAQRRIQPVLIQPIHYGTKSRKRLSRSGPTPHTQLQPNGSARQFGNSAIDLACATTFLIGMCKARSYTHTCQKHAKRKLVRPQTPSLHFSPSPSLSVLLAHLIVSFERRIINSTCAPTICRLIVLSFGIAVRDRDTSEVRSSRYEQMKPHAYCNATPVAQRPMLFKPCCP